MDYEEITRNSALAVVFISAIILIFKIYSRLQSPLMKKWPKNLVVLFQYAVGPNAPSLSPFSLKLMTYFRFAGIPYMTVYGRNVSSKGKIPWVIYNGEPVEDSEFIIRYFNSLFDIDLSKDLTASEKATSLAFQRMVEEHLFWSLCGSTFDTDDDSKLSSLFPYGALKTWFVVKMLKYGIRKEMWCHGIGRHCKADYISMGLRATKALSTQLGTKRFFMGNNPSEVDCTIFGFLAQILWHMPGSEHQKLMTEKLSNLVDYCHRMKTRFWPDWDDIVKKQNKDKTQNFEAE